MKYIKEYIQFAIDNGYLVGYSMSFNKEECLVTNDIIQDKDYIDEMRCDINGTKIISFSNFNGEFVLKGTKSVIELITSKEFIEAIARGIFTLNPNINGKYGRFEKKLDWITHNQAIAIRDGKLEKFIEDILYK